jgi:hypothetical protein
MSGSPTAAPTGVFTNATECGWFTVLGDDFSNSAREEIIYGPYLVYTVLFIFVLLLFGYHFLRAASFKKAESEADADRRKKCWGMLLVERVDLEVHEEGKRHFLDSSFYTLTVPPFSDCTGSRQAQKADQRQDSDRSS